MDVATLHDQILRVAARESRRDFLADFFTAMAGK